MASSAAQVKVSKTTTPPASTWEELLTAPTTGVKAGVMGGLNILNLHLLSGSSKLLASVAKATLASLPRPVLLEGTPLYALEYIDWATLKSTAFTGFKCLQRADARITHEDYRAGCIVQPGNILIASGFSAGGEMVEEMDRQEFYEETIALDGTSSWFGETEDDGTAMLPLGDGRVVKIGCSVFDPSEPRINAARVCKVDPSSGKISEWKDLASMSEFRKDFAFAKLHDGRIIVAGGDMEWPSAEILDVEANTWTDAKIPAHIDPHESRHGVVLNDGRFILLSAKGKFVAAFDPSAVSEATNNGWVWRSSESEGWPDAPPVAPNQGRDMIPACVGGNVLLFPNGRSKNETSGVWEYSAFLLNDKKWIKMPILNPPANGIIRVMQWQHQQTTAQ
tara:strand:- start:105 stop:1283 length:1179 start_codon:yes stop_codon:yes gene_type:complete